MAPGMDSRSGTIRPMTTSVPDVVCGTCGSDVFDISLEQRVPCPSCGSLTRHFTAPLVTADPFGALRQASDAAVAEVRAQNDQLRLQLAEMQKLAMQDPLTTLRNRLGIEAWRTAAGRAGQTSWTMIQLDLDDFKTINDVFDHFTGDDALRAIANCLTEHAPEGACVARWGGDEFFIAVDEMAPSHAADLCEQVCQAVRRIELASAPGRTLTVSVGFACAPEDGVDWTEVHRAADKATLTAKARGKDGWASAADR